MDEFPAVGPWARDKLQRLSKYLGAYTKILSRSRFKNYVYIDAFAGAGQSIVRGSGTSRIAALFEVEQKFRTDQEAREVLDGSPRIALDIEPPFTQYVFLDRDPARVQSLRRLETEYRARRKIVVRQSDCNAYLAALVNNPRIHWNEWRGVVFLDPFGMQVSWNTISAIAKTGALEVFLNLPVGMAIQRLLKRSGQFTNRERAKLDDYFGDSGWFEMVYPHSNTLFGLELSKAENAAQNLVEWYRERLKLAFGHVSGAYLVRNTTKGHLYYLIFAGPNATGKKIADYILTGGHRI